MINKTTHLKKSSFEKITLIALCILFITAFISAWAYSFHIRSKIISQATSESITQQAEVEIERLRNLSDSQFNKSLHFFLLGSSSLFDEQKNEKQKFSELLISYSKKHPLSGIDSVVKRIESSMQQRQDIFDQAMAHRSKQTESKIVGQFYRAKTATINNDINKAFQEMITLHKNENERTRNEAKISSLEAEKQIPQGMMWLTITTGVLFLAMVLLVIRAIIIRDRSLVERDRLYAEAIKLNLSRDELTAGIANDLKEPLSDISYAVKNDSTESSHVIQSSVEIIENRIKDILDEAKISSGNLILRLDQMGLNDILDDTRLMMYPFAKQKDIRLEMNEVNPPVLAFLDRERVMRVLSNIIGNAIKFSPKLSKVIVRVRQDQQFVYISVKDSGPGIPEKQIPQLFDRFWQATKTSDDGAGIGLSVAKSIIEAHGGNIKVESHMGSGTTFTFSLPRRRPAGLEMGRPVVSTVKSGPRALPQKQDAQSSELSSI
jgi:signal transduction histidine kinase